MSTTPETTADLRLHLIGYERFETSVKFLSAVEDDISVMQWGRRQKIHVYRHAGISTGEQLRAAIAEPCAGCLISCHGGHDDSNGEVWLCQDSEVRVFLDVRKVDQVGATSLVIVDACSTRQILPELSHRTTKGAVLVGIDGKNTAGRDSVQLLADVMREVCYAAKPDLSPSAIMSAVDRVTARINARNDLVKGKRAQAPRLLIENGCADTTLV
jgi:hypothetical protein